MTTTQKTLAQEARDLKKLRISELAAKVKHSEAKVKREIAERKLIERMDGEEVSSIKTGGTLFVYAKTTYGNIQDRAAFVAWAKENDEELIESKERKGLVHELVRERLDNGEELPPGIGFYVDEYVSQRAA